MEAPDPKGRKVLGGTDESSSNRGGGNDRCESSGGVGGSLEFVNGDADCVGPCGKRLMNSVIVDQSRSCKRSEESAE